MKRLLGFVIVAVAMITLGLSGCKEQSKSEQPSTSTEQPSKTEHPSTEHPSKTGEHPSAEEPT